MKTVLFSLSLVGLALAASLATTKPADAACRRHDIRNNSNEIAYQWRGCGEVMLFGIFSWQKNELDPVDRGGSDGYVAPVQETKHCDWERAS